MTESQQGFIACTWGTEQARHVGQAKRVGKEMLPSEQGELLLGKPLTINN